VTATAEPPLDPGMADPTLVVPARESATPPAVPERQELPPQPDLPPVDAEQKPQATWRGQLSFGITGTGGNSDLLEFRTTGKATRTLPKREILALNWTYRLTEDEGDRRINRFNFTGRQDWLVPDEPWTFFLRNSVELNEFKHWDARVQLGAGLGWRFIETERTALTGRLGAAGTRDIGGETRIRPEAIVSLDFHHDLSDRHRLTAQIEAFPALDGDGEYRVNSEVAWDILLDPDSKISLRLGAEDRYDSDAGDADHHDYSYFATLVIDF
jgi:putative salt-induced outer membrane protein YdiY